MALLLSPWQFARRLRTRHPRVHRVVGWASAVAIVVSAGAGLIMAPFNSAGFVGFFGFGALAVLWGFTTIRAVNAVRRRDLANHQAWMIRSFALTYAAVTLRLWLVLLIFIQVPFLSGDNVAEVARQNAYLALPFLAWLPNIVVAEVLIRNRHLPSFRLVDTEQLRRSSGMLSSRSGREPGAR